jgi:two-component sensor histidine kinase
MSPFNDRSVEVKWTAADRAKLVDALDHDVRQPQHSMEMGLRTLRLKMADLKARRFNDANFDSLVSEVTGEVASVQEAARQVTDTLRDLLDAIRLEFDEVRSNPRTIHAGDLIERISKSNRGLAGDIEIHGISSRLTFVSDERWVERILNNLVGNAIWHSQGNRVLVGARRSADDVVFEVRDNGRGMTPEKVSTIFNPVRNPALPHTWSSAARSGLGLYIVRLFTERLGGSVDCHSVPGRGTRFRVRLPGPVALAEAHRCAAESAIAEAARNKLLTVLDDDHFVLHQTEQAFSPLGIEVYADHDPLRWLSVVTDLGRRPDLILMDFQLGSERCSLQLDIVRRKWSGERLNVIVLADNDRDPSLRRASKYVPVLKKPLSGRKLNLILAVLGGQLELPSFGFL